MEEEELRSSSVLPVLAEEVGVAVGSDGPPVGGVDVGVVSAYNN